MATAQNLKMSHPHGLGVDSRVDNLQNNTFSAAAGVAEQSLNSDGSVQINSLGSQGTSNTAIAAPVPAPRVHRRRGCQHCITCSGLQHHCHSASVK